MGKVNKRQRKFLSKNVLTHRKKGGVRRDNKSKGKGAAAAAAAATAPEASQAPGAQHRKTLPDGVDTAAFLECPWLSQEACAAAGRDACVAPFEPEVALLEGAATSKSGKRGGGGKGSGSSSLTEQAARAMIGRAVDERSLDDLLRVVWAVQAIGDPSSAAVPTTCHQPLRAAPGSKAADALISEASSRLHLAFRAHLGPERDEEDGSSVEEWEDAVRAHRQKLEKAEAWPRLGGALLSFLTSALDSVDKAWATSISVAVEGRADSSKRGSSGASSASLVDGLDRMRNHVPLLFPFPRLARRYLSFLLAVLQTSDSTPALSLAFVRLYELSTSQPMPFLHDAFKGSYRCYRAAAERIGGGRGARVMARGDGAGSSLPLLRECLAELFGVEKPSAYLHAYVYIHEIAREASEAAAEVKKGGGKAREAGPALRRLRSWGFLQGLQLWTSVVTAHPAKSSLGPLVPPLAKALEITFQLSPGLYGAPRTLALARSAHDLAAAAGVFLPTSHYLVGLLELLHAREARPGATARSAGGPADGEEAGPGGLAVANGGGSSSKRQGRGAAAAAALDLSAMAGLGKEDLRVAEVRAAVSREAAGLIAREAVCYRWSAGMPELCASTGARLGRLLDGGGGGGGADGATGRWRARVKALQTSLRKSAAETMARRARGSKHPGEAGPVDTFRDMDESTATQRLRAFKEPS
ncbi:unnamed protein product [Ectocarpus sp. 12 AP-2014]